MKLSLIGVGGAGGAVVDAFLDRDPVGAIRDAMALDTDARDLHLLQSVPGENRLLLAEERLVGEGTNGAFETGQEAFEDDADAAEELVESLATRDVDACLVVAGLGGGTGGGCGPSVARLAADRCGVPVFGLALLPDTDEGTASERNAALGLKPFYQRTDGLVAFDLDSFDGDDPTEAVLDRLEHLCWAGEDGGLPAAAVVDTLRAGISTVGFASERIDEGSSGGLLSRFTGGDERRGDVERLNDLVRASVLGDLTLPADCSTADRVLLAATGPPARVPEMGIAQGREWLESKVDAERVRAGELPVDGDRMGVLTLFSGISEAERLDRLADVAREHRSNVTPDRERLPTLVVDDAATGDVAFNEGVQVGVAVVEGTLTDPVAARTASRLLEFGGEVVVAAGELHDSARETLADHGVVVVDVAPGQEVTRVARALGARAVFDGSTLDEDDVGFAGSIQSGDLSESLALAVRADGETVATADREREAESG